MSGKYLCGCLFFAVILLPLSSSYGDWESEANARIESNRKRDAQITVLGLGEVPIDGVSVEIEQIKHRFGFGAALAPSPLHPSTGNANYKNFVLDHFEWAVCENAMKWGEIEGDRDDEDYDDADIIADWCANNDIILRGHCILWEQNNNQMPGWLKTLGCSQMVPEIEERVDSIVGRYAGQIVSWDVDNEMLPTGTNYDFFGTCLGDQGRADVFNRAKQIDPDCGMYMNEYTGNSFGGYDGDQYVARANSLINTYGAQIDGLGIQAHVASPFQPENYYNNVLNELDDLGLPIIATEFSVNNQYDEYQIATDLENFYRICFSHSSVEGIIMWGFLEGAAWQWRGIVDSDWTLNAGGVKYEDLMDEWTTTDSDTTDGSGNADFRGFHGIYEITLTKAGETPEIHEIELEPGGGTQLFTLNTNFSGGGFPGKATNPSPGNGVSDISINADLSWTAGTDANSHDVYFGTDSTPDSGEFQDNQPGTTFEPGTLSYNTTYYWRIDEKNDTGTTTGDVWSFTTVPPLPGQATGPSPGNGVPDVSINADLSWTAGSDATSHDVYFGTDSTPDSGEFQGNQPGTTFEPGTLSYSTTYYWRIDEENVSGTTTGDVWSFTTSAPDTTPPTPDPTWASPPTAAGPTSITMTSTTATDTESPPVYYYFECTTDGDANSGWQENDPTYVATGLNPLTSYAFRVKARDNALVPNETGWSIEESATTYPSGGGDVEIIGSWEEEPDLSRTKVAGTDRLLIFIAHCERDGAISLNGVTYGGQAMTNVIDIVTGTSGYRNYVAAFILDEPNIVAAGSGDTFVPSWSTTPESVTYASVFLENVDQTNIIGATDSANVTVDTVVCGPLDTNDGDMVIVAAVTGHEGEYTLNNLFIEGTDQTDGAGQGHTGVTGHKAAIGDPETPSATYISGANRNAIIGLVVQAGGEWLYGDFTGDDIVDMNDMPGFFGFWLMDDCSDTNAIDLDEDCVINFHEFSVIGGNWLK